MQLRKRLTVVVLLASIGVLALAGTAGASPAKTVPPDTWATSICTVTNGWLSGYSSGETQVTTALSGASVAPADAKAAIDSFFATGTTATKAALAALKKAGAPKAKNGAGISKSLVTAFRTIQKQVAAAKKKVAALDPTQAEFDTQATAVVSGLHTGVGKALAKFSAYGQKNSDKALTKVLDTNKACNATTP